MSTKMTEEELAKVKRNIKDPNVGESVKDWYKKKLTAHEEAVREEKK